MMQLAGIMLAGAVVAVVCFFIGLTVGLLAKMYGHNKRECRECQRRLVKNGFSVDGEDYEVARRIVRGAETTREDGSEEDGMVINFTCDQTIRRDELQRKLDRMSPETGIRRRLLDLFYDTGTLWTWHTALGIVLFGIPYTALLGICVVGAASAFLCSIPIVWSLDLAEGILRWFAHRALQKYRRVKRDRDAIIASGNTRPQGGNYA